MTEATAARIRQYLFRMGESTEYAEQVIAGLTATKDRIATKNPGMVLAEHFEDPSKLLPRYLVIGTSECGKKTVWHTTIEPPPAFTLDPADRVAIAACMKLNGYTEPQIEAEIDQCIEIARSIIGAYPGRRIRLRLHFREDCSLWFPIDYQFIDEDDPSVLITGLRFRDGLPSDPSRGHIAKRN